MKERNTAPVFERQELICVFMGRFLLTESADPPSQVLRRDREDDWLLTALGGEERKAPWEPRSFTEGEGTDDWLLTPEAGGKERKAPWEPRSFTEEAGRRSGVLIGLG